jgi:hypothetical protein
MEKVPMPNGFVAYMNFIIKQRPEPMVYIRTLNAIILHIEKI